jgi:hypothetical protein
MAGSLRWLCKPRQAVERAPAGHPISDNPAVDQIMNAGEAAFARRDLNEALTICAKALKRAAAEAARAWFH